MLRWALALVAVATACSGTSSSTTAGTLPPPGTIVVTTTTIPRPTPLPLCEPPPYFPAVLPSGVTSPEDQDLPADRYTAIEGTSTLVFVDEGGAPKVVIIRGSLPPDEWAGRTVRVEVAGIQAALGTMPDGAWAVAWTESGARCDQYSLIVYPPTTREEVEVVAMGLGR